MLKLRSTVESCQSEYRRQRSPTILHVMDLEVLYAPIHDLSEQCLIRQEASFGEPMKCDSGLEDSIRQHM